MEGFELFNNSNISRVVDKITITKNYLINFPTAFYRINNLADKKMVLLYYNKNENKMAVGFTNEEDARGFKITNSGGGHYGGYITAKNFFAMNGLIGKIRIGRYDYTTVNEDQKDVDRRECFVIQLESN